MTQKRETTMKSATRLVLIVTTCATAACTMQRQDAPALSGPSEFGQSVSVAASPDILPQDGGSQSVVTVTARGANGEPLRNLGLRAQIVVDGIAVDFGSLSARSIVTGNDGRGTFVYTAPASPAVSVDAFTVVDIEVTPVGSDFNNSVARRASIRLIPQGIVVPSDGLVASFTFAPTAPSENQDVFFDASGSQARTAIVRYDWDFGDGDHGSGRTTTHDYAVAGTYHVTLTVTEEFGRTASTTRQVTVTAGQNPTAAFEFSPTTPLIGQQVNFNAATSRAAPGRTIQSYTWDFGDGTSGTGVQASRTYTVAGTYTVLLTVRDDLGRIGTVARQVTVAKPTP